MVRGAHPTWLRSVDMPNGCFVAGTLVHTKEGLVPIEQVKVGDWVLSQPEEKGEQAYKQVVKTFVFEDKEIILVRVCNAAEVYELGVTPNHPFWVKDVGWTRADDLDTGAILELQDTSTIGVLCVTRVYRTDISGVGWAKGAWVAEANDGSGNFINFRDKSIDVAKDKTFNWNVFESENVDTCFRQRVFNIEVSDFHTYYIGELGIWVHNTHCGDIGVSLVEATLGIRPSPRSRVYDDSRIQFRNLTGSNQGVILVLEQVETNTARRTFQQDTFGSLIKANKNSPTQSVAWSLRYNNTITGPASGRSGVNVIKLGDGRVYFSDGVTWSNTFIDAKSGQLGLGTLYKEFLPAGFNTPEIVMEPCRVRTAHRYR